KLRWVMTDFAESNLRAWQGNDRLKGLAESGVLDFGLFDLERDSELRLERSGETLGKGSARNPMLAVANYAFDTTLQDAFFLKDGVLQEALATLMSTGPEEDLKDPALLERAGLRFEPRPLKGGYYEDAALNRVLERYRQRLGDTCFLVPVGALRVIRTLREWAGGRLFLLCGDKAVSREEDLLGRADASLAFHGGSVSMMVNLHALGLYFEELGGFALHSLQRDNRLRVSALASGLPDMPESRLAFRETMNGFSPRAYVELLGELRKGWAEPTLDAIMDLLRLSDWDFEVLASWKDVLRKHLASAPEAVKQELVEGLRRVWDRFYPMGKDMAFELTRVCLAMKEAREAIFYARESLRLFGDSHLAWFSLGLALTLVGEYREGLDCIDKSLALEPANMPARDLKIRLEGKLAHG
ncbi:MAG: tetratricopeptide repeat protein, partial [Myxococcaceae bacterium]|nr:tetratricopeptide repeat protein [Myxococcaceae bacterium]